MNEMSKQAMQPSPYTTNHLKNIQTRLVYIKIENLFIFKLFPSSIAALVNVITVFFIDKIKHLKITERLSFRTHKKFHYTISHSINDVIKIYDVENFAMSQLRTC